MMKSYYHCCFGMIIGFFLIPAQIEAALSPSERKLEELMEIQYLNDKARSPYDLTQIKGETAVIQVWRDLPPEPRADEIECLGYQWLLSGRGAKIGEGAAAVFREFPELSSLELRLVDLSFETKSQNKKGQITKEAQVKTYLRMKIQKAEISKYSINNSRVKKELRSNTEACLRVGRKLAVEKEIQL